MVPEEMYFEILDGGLGTTLEDDFGQDVNSPLWSACLVDKKPETIINAHIAFLEAGANILLTSTYQCSRSTLEKAGYEEDEARRIMYSSVKLAAEAKSRFLASSAEKRPIKIALSLGSYGSTLSPAQEFDGYYPPPFGPLAYRPEGENTTTFNDPRAEEDARQALKDFHLERLLTFYNTDVTWPLIDMVAFETVPLEREIWAIRMAIMEFKKTVRESDWKPWYISTVWKPGASESSEFKRGANRSLRSITTALGSRETNLPLPDGIGINCTQLSDLDKIVVGFRLIFEEITFKENFKPFLVLYPNGGELYDVVTRSWQSNIVDGHLSWVAQLADLAKREQNSGFWSRAIVGGCCKTGPRHIQALSKKLTSST